LPYIVRFFSPPESTVTDFLVSSPGERAAARGGADELVVVGLAGQVDIQLNRSIFASNSACGSCGM
jgi:hypothetical protein